MRSLRHEVKAASVLLGFYLVAAAQSPPKYPDEPFDVYVFTDTPSEPDDKSSIEKTTEEVAKRLGKRKKWFHLVASRDEAELIVEVLNQWEGRDASRTYVRRADNADPSDPQITSFLDVDKAFTLETKLFMPQAAPIPMKVSGEGRRPRDIAKTFAERLESFCRMNYWILMKALER